MGGMKLGGDVLQDGMPPGFARVMSKHRRGNDYGNPFGMHLRSRTWSFRYQLLRATKFQAVCVLALFTTIFCVTLGVWLRIGPVKDLVGIDSHEGMPDHFCGGQEGELGKVELYMMWGEDLKQEDAMLRPFGMVEFWDRDRNTRSGLGQGPSSGMKPHGGRLYDWYQARIGWDVAWGQAAVVATRDPTWDPMFKRYYCIRDTTEKINLQLWDDNILTENMFIGGADIGIEDILKEQPSPGLFNSETILTLRDKKGEFAGRVGVTTRFYPTKHLADIMSDLESGDILLFSGATINGNFIKASTKSEWSHVGLVYKDNSSVLKMIESSTNHAHLYDCDTGTPNWGVEKVSLLDKVYSSFYDKVAVRRLILPGGREKREVKSKQLHDFYESKMGIPYEEFKLEMVKAYFNWNTANDKSRDTLFCSEFVALAYLKLGLLEQGKVPSNVLQWEFSSQENMAAELSQGAYLQNEVYLKNVQQYPQGKCYMQPETCECGPQKTAYDASFACFSRPCGSIWKLVWGGMIDLGLGYPLEIFITTVGMGLVFTAILANLFACVYIHNWMQVRRKALKFKGQDLERRGSNASLMSATKSPRTRSRSPASRACDVQLDVLDSIQSPSQSRSPTKKLSMGGDAMGEVADCDKEEGADSLGSEDTNGRHFSCEIAEIATLAPTSTLKLKRGGIVPAVLPLKSPIRRLRALPPLQEPCRIVVGVAASPSVSNLKPSETDSIRQSGSQVGGASALSAAGTQPRADVGKKDGVRKARLLRPLPPLRIHPAPPPDSQGESGQ